MRSLAILATLATLAACERERVEVAEAEAGSVVPGADPEPPNVTPVFAAEDGGADASGPTCGPPPAIGRCGPCPTGYSSLEDGGATCQCCP